MANFSETESSRADGLLFFGDFDEHECGKYFEKVKAVKFVRLQSQDGQRDADLPSDVKSCVVASDEQREGELSEKLDSMTLDAEPQDSNNGGCFMASNTNAACEVQPLNNENDQHLIAGDDMFMRKSTFDSKKQGDQKPDGDAVQDKPVPEGSVAPKSKPVSWAALFKSNSNAPATNLPTVVSVNFEESESKNSGPEIQENSFSEKTQRSISVENDQDAAALADFLQKTSLHPNNSLIQLRGLINNGNWCYINATLQSLLGCQAFYHLFKSMAGIKQKNEKLSSTPLTDTMIQFANEFSFLDNRVFQHKGKKTDDLRLGTSFEPKKVYEILSVLKSTLSETGKQQDAEEFLTFLLNGLHEEFVSLNSLAQNSKTKNHFAIKETFMNGSTEEVTPHKSTFKDQNKAGTEKEEAADEWEQVGRNNKTANLRKTSASETLITKLYGGIIRSSVHHAGAKESATLQPFFTIQLDIQAENIWNIKDAFENYFTKESIEGFTSSKTKSKVEASHKTSLEKLPQVLILHLKYFVYDKTGGCQKIHKHIDIARELEIPKDVLSSSLKGRVPANQRTYELFAVEFHLGKHAAGGHYTTAVRHKEPLGWVYCNDSIIQKTQFNQITKQHKDKVPYLLFYERVNHFAN
ncbi:ubiquitin carboxyl-terminal hydrolase 10-like [Rhopilema esculentum]|uniref:ubiquitin carboxyl-terminal hydrolase 10-like n=1 Tax=Rhopilema esculentum TaxID=499914 RepID=UPI0031E40B6C